MELGQVNGSNEQQQQYWHCSVAHCIAVCVCVCSRRQSLRYPGTGSKTRHEWESSDEEDEDLISGNAPDKREEDKKKDDK